MSIVAFSKQNEYDTVQDEQDCRGWTVYDQAGNEVGKVSEMLVNTETELVDSIIVDGSVRVAAVNIALDRENRRVTVRGVLNSEDYNNTRQTALIGDYSEMSGAENQNFVSGVTRAADDKEIVVPIIEEQLRVGKRTVESGGARIQTGIKEIPVETEVNLREERVRVERHAVDRPATNADLQTFGEGEIELTEHSEVAVVAKEARVVEEISIGKEVTEREETIRDTVRRTDVEIENIDDEETRRRTANG